MHNSNPYSVKNVNQKSGPRTGNASARAGKRGEFQAAKAEREPLANMIQSALGARAPHDSVNPQAEGIHPVTAVKFKK